MAGDQESTDTQRYVSKQEFGARLQRLMFEKGWTQSELARRAQLRRDAVSTYIRGAAFPKPASLHKLATTLGVEPEDLQPNYAEQAVGDGHPSIDMKVSGQDEAHLKIDCRISLKAALAIIQMINDDKQEAGREQQD